MMTRRSLSPATRCRIEQNNHLTLPVTCHSHLTQAYGCAPFRPNPPLLQRMKAAPSAALGGGALWAKEPPHAAKKAGMLPTSHSAAPQATAGAWQGQLPSRAPSRVSVQPIPEALPPGRGAAWGYGGPTGAVAHL
jgi:hypothetical protein